jgi:hypothetical protein
LQAPAVLSRLPTPGRWNVFAVETSASGGPIEDFFNDHAHHVIAQDVDETEGRQLAQDYAQKWLAGEVTPTPPCACGEIGTIENRAP